VSPTGSRTSTRGLIRGARWRKLGPLDRLEPDCRTCAHYFVTYEPTHPHGCRAFDFKSQLWPARVVTQSSGEACHAHEARPAPKGAR